MQDATIGMLMLSMFIIATAKIMFSIHLCYILEFQRQVLKNQTQLRIIVQQMQMSVDVLLQRDASASFTNTSNTEDEVEAVTIFHLLMENDEELADMENKLKDPKQRSELVSYQIVCLAHGTFIPC